jgi:hypothetical protein
VDADRAVLVEAEGRQGAVFDGAVDGGRVHAELEGDLLDAKPLAFLMLISECYLRVLADKRHSRPVARRSPIHIDEARLRPHLRADREKGELPASAALGDVLEAEAELVRRQRGRDVVPSPAELRGLPVIGGGPGASPGSNPVAALLAKERGRR